MKVGKWNEVSQVIEDYIDELWDVTRFEGLISEVGSSPDHDNEEELHANRKGNCCFCVQGLRLGGIYTPGCKPEMGVRYRHTT